MFGQKRLIDAAANGDLKAVMHYLAKGVDVNARDWANNTALIAATEGGHTDVVRYLLSQPGIDVNAENISGMTALINAAAHGNEEIVKELLKVDNISLAATYKGKKHSPITIARQNGHKRVAQLLENFTASKNIKPSIPKPPKL